jgi:hypothetical protein
LAARKKADEAQAALNELAARLDAAKASHAKWSALLQTEKAKPGARRISMR